MQRGQLLASFFLGQPGQQGALTRSCNAEGDGSNMENSNAASPRHSADGGSFSDSKRICDDVATMKEGDNDGASEGGSTVGQNARSQWLLAGGEGPGQSKNGTWTGSRVEGVSQGKKAKSSYGDEESA